MYRKRGVCAQHAAEGQDELALIMEHARHLTDVGRDNTTELIQRYMFGTRVAPFYDTSICNQSADWSLTHYIALTSNDTSRSFTSSYPIASYIRTAG